MVNEEGTPGRGWPVPPVVPSPAGARAASPPVGVGVLCKLRSLSRLAEHTARAWEGAAARGARHGPSALQVRCAAGALCGALAARCACRRAPALLEHSLYCGRPVCRARARTR